METQKTQQKETTMLLFLDQAIKVSKETHQLLMKDKDFEALHSIMFEATRYADKYKDSTLSALLSTIAKHFLKIIHHIDKELIRGEK